MKKKIIVFSYILIAAICIFFAVRNIQLRDEISQNQETTKVYSQYTSTNDNKTDKEEEIEKLKTELEKVNKELSDKNESIKRERKSYEERISNLYQDFKQNSYLLNAIKGEKDTFDILSMNTIYVNDRIYTSFAKSYEIVPKNLDIESKLNIIADCLSENFFGGKIIKIKEIKEIQGKKIAFINLIDKEEKRTWSSSFQGSTGGLITTTQLTSFLQSEYEGQWIDGVKFLYEGKDIAFQHVPELNEIIYRKDITDSVEQYFPSKRKVLKYSGGFENSGYSNTVEEIENEKVLIKHSDTAIENGEVYEVTSQYIKLIYSSGESYDKNKNYINEIPNRDNILLKGPIKIGTTWNQGKSIITGINVLVETPEGAFNTVEVTNYEENYKSKIYFAQDVGIVKKIYKYGDEMEIVEELVESR